MHSVPYIVDVEELAMQDITIGDWLEENQEIMTDLVMQAGILLIEEEEESVSVVEIWDGPELICTIELEKSGAVEALTNVMNRYAEIELYEKAARARDLIQRVKI